MSKRLRVSCSSFVGFCLTSNALCSQKPTLPTYQRLLERFGVTLQARRRECMNWRAATACRATWFRLWVRKYEAGEYSDELAEAVRVAGCERKIAELERKVGQLAMEVDLLKKRGATGTRRERRELVDRGRPGAPIHHARIPTHQARSFNLLLPPAPPGCG